MNVLHESPAIQVGLPDSDCHVTETGYIYRTMAPDELEHARKIGVFICLPYARQKKYWVRGGTGQFYRPNSGRLVVRLHESRFNLIHPVKFADIELIGA